MIKKSAQICLICVICVLPKVVAQAPVFRPPNELSIHLGGGTSSIHYHNVPRVGFYNGYAFDVGIGYTVFAHRNFGIYVGFEHGIYNTNKSVYFNSLNPHLTDQNGHQFDLHSIIGYSEAFETSFVNLPVMLIFQTRKGSIFEPWSRRSNVRQGFFAMCGFRLSFPVKDKFDSQITSLTYSAYYSEMDNWGATQKFAGLGQFEGLHAKGNIELPMWWRLSLETGFKWRFNDKYVLYTSLFCDIGINNTVQNEREPFRNQIAVEHITNFVLLEFPDKVNIVITGIKIRFARSKIQDSTHCPLWR